MNNAFKPGGGNKPQPYIPAGNGEQSGEYTNKPQSNKEAVFDCQIKEVLMQCNPLKSKMVKKVQNYYSLNSHSPLPLRIKPNSVIKKIAGENVASERYYDENGDVYLDIDYTCHGNPYTHPEVPHIHRWTKNENGELRREKWESFK